MEDSVSLAGKLAPGVKEILDTLVSEFRIPEKARRPICVLTDSTAVDEGSVSELEARAGSVLLNLEDIELVRLSGRLPLTPIRWVSSRDPRELLGPLVDQYEGAYYRRLPDLQLVYSTRDRIEIFALPPAASRSLELATAVAIALELGVPASTLKTRIWMEASLRLEDLHSQEGRAHERLAQGARQHA